MRDVEARVGGPADVDADVAALVVPGDPELPDAAARVDDEWLGGALSRRIREEGFRGEASETCFFPTSGDRPHVLAVGLGEGDERLSAAERLRRAAGTTVRAARDERAASVAFLPDPTLAADAGESGAAASAEGLVLGDWALESFLGEEARSERPPPPSRVTLVWPEGVGPRPEAVADAVRRGRIVAEAQNDARELVAGPPNVVTPRHLARRALEMGDEHGLSVETWGPDRLREEGFGALLAVARGSEQEPRFIVLEHEGGSADARPYVVAGKGVTFDSGGISLKPSKGMEDMKFDMGGAAAVLGALRAAADLDLPRRVVGLVPSAENLPSGTALKPSDVIRGVSGTSIEVVNTDAEGRLLLSDALSWARRELDPRAMVDLATLTGGCVVALGHEAAGLMANDDSLAGRLTGAGERTGEFTWRLPLWPPYREALDSEIADIRNSAGKEASAITAGWFLREFVGDEVPWVHLDIAGTAWTEEDRPYHRKGPTGFGVRLVVEWLRSEA